MTKEEVAKRVREKKYISVLLMPGGYSQTGEPEEADL